MELLGVPKAKKQDSTDCKQNGNHHDIILAGKRYGKPSEQLRESHLPAGTKRKKADLHYAKSHNGNSDDKLQADRGNEWYET